MTTPAIPPMPERPEIGGSTRLYAVLGCPVAQVKAPALLNPVFARLGLDAVLVPVLAEPAHLGEIVRGLQRIGNLDGLLVTVPHKAEVRRYADTVSSAVTQSGSANALRREPDGRWSAENFDGIGFVRGLRASGFDLSGKRVSLIGAGGAGGALAAAVLAAGAAHLDVCDRDESRVSEVTNRLGPYWPGRLTGSVVPRLDGADLAVNATPLGLRPEDPLPFDVAGLPPGAEVADIIMEPRETALLRAAEARGHRIHHGSHMLIHQLDLYREFFRLNAPERAELS
ncbi:shikimate dehydrogenase family protein [Streptomyces sp. LMG1-1-1.1]|uniref:shikimate dehydrogenase family protein n=1 Tax=Streptomyces sp. LMG1-1-1.1 TaxID=3135245 RepID=UPI003465AD1B